MKKEDDKKIISKVRKNKANNQRRVTIPKEDITLVEGDLVEIKKLIIE